MDIRAVLVELMIDEGIDDIEFAAMLEMVEDEERENRAMFLRNFSLDDFSEVGCEENFRFSKDEITRLCQLLRFPDTMTAYNGTISPGLEVLCIVMKRLSYPCRYMDLERFFCRPRREMSRPTHVW
ncbi:uncharacterized protein [Littorina saxatilis]|uniref:uncharacterized protein n=1 Tax=Littorina saxatilis TaxID=31220 RepID=UPI0038B602FC